MTFKGKISRFVTQFLMLLTAPVMIAALLYCLIYVGKFVIELIMKGIAEFKGAVYPFYAPNRYYSPDPRVVERRVTKEHDIRDKQGVKIGTYETEETEEFYEFDSQYNRTAPLWKFGIYILCYPFCRIVSFIASFIALFTDKFYVQVTTPAEYYAFPEKYSKFLLCYFDIVVPRSHKAIQRYFKREDRRKKKQRNRVPLEKEELYGLIGVAVFPPATAICFVGSLLALLTMLEKPADDKDKIGTKRILRVSSFGVVFWVLLAFSIILYVELRIKLYR